MKNILFCILFLGFSLTANSQQIKTINSYVTYEDGEEKFDGAKEYDAEGKILSQEVLRFHTQTEYEYDEKGRIKSEDAMYAETGSKTKYFYNDKVDSEIIFAGNTFRKIESYKNKSGVVTKRVEYDVYEDAGIKSVTESAYNKEGLVLSKRTSVKTFLINDIPYEVNGKNADKIINEVFDSKVIKTSIELETFTYDSNKQVLEHKKYLNSKIVDSFVYAYLPGTSSLTKVTKFYKKKLISYEDFIYNKNRISKHIVFDYSESKFTKFGDGLQNSLESTIYSYNNSGDLVQKETIYDSNLTKVSKYKNGNIVELIESYKGKISEKIRYEYIFY